MTLVGNKITLYSIIVHFFNTHNNLQSSSDFTTMWGVERNDPIKIQIGEFRDYLNADNYRN